jgi:hypothetical protein
MLRTPAIDEDQLHRMATLILRDCLVKNKKLPVLWIDKTGGKQLWFTGLVCKSTK